MLLINCNDSTAGIFTFLSEVVTAANLPMYIGCALAVVALWRSGRIAQPTARDLRWIAAALVATVYCIWVFIGMGAKPFLWALLLGAAGIPVYWWYALRREAVAAPST
jgi:APA family basic amino acid/polyamine antiporter